MKRSGPEVDSVGVLGGEGVLLFMNVAVFTVAFPLTFGNLVKVTCKFT